MDVAICRRMTHEYSEFLKDLEIEKLTGSISVTDRKINRHKQ